MAEYRTNIIRNAVIAVLVTAGIVGAAYSGAGPLASEIQHYAQTTIYTIPITSTSIPQTSVQSSSSTMTSFTSFSSSSTTSTSLRTTSTSAAASSSSFSTSTSAASTSSQTAGNTTVPITTMNTTTQASCAASSTSAPPGNQSSTNEQGCWRVTTFSVGNTPDSVTYDPVDRKMFVTIPNADQIDVFNGTNQMIMEFGGDGDMLSPHGIVYNSVNGEIYVADAAWDSVSVFNPNTYALIANISLGQKSPQSITYSQSTGLVYVANYANSTVSVINETTNQVVGSPIAVGSEPTGIAYDPANGDIYVSNSNSSSVTVIDNASSIVGTIDVGRLPEGIAFNPNNKAMYVAELGNQANGAVVVINSSSNAVVSNITGVGPEPYGIAYDSNGNYVVVTCGALDCVNILNATSNGPVTSISVGSVPGNLAYDSANGDMYVLNTESGSVSVISKS